MNKVDLSKVDHEEIELLLCKYCGNLLNQQKRNMKDKGIAFTCDVCSNISLFTNSIIIYDSSNITSFNYDGKFTNSYKEDKTIQRAIINEDKVPIFLGQLSDKYVGIIDVDSTSIPIQPY